MLLPALQQFPLQHERRTGSAVADDQLPDIGRPRALLTWTALLWTT